LTTIIMTVTETPGELNKFGRTPWRFQRTFQTPRKNLQPFVATIMAAMRQTETATVTLDEVVFEPKHLLALVAPTEKASPLQHDTTISAVGHEEVEALLAAALSDWVDFLFIPQPKPFVIYADHDEYTTFYAASRSNLNRVTAGLAAKGFKEIEGYTRTRR
jgi:hypothetical protein